uniref:Uncharacterized protein n=1 Tax=Parascaris univalens TaxID=6257 RepID=A0A915ARC4_PARUN
MPKVRGCKFTMQRNDRILLSNGEEYTVEEELHVMQEERILTPSLYDSFEVESLHSLNRSIEAICEGNAPRNSEPKSKIGESVAINAIDALPDSNITSKQTGDDSTLDITAQIERIKNTIQKAANETTIYDQSYNDAQPESQPSDIIADLSEITPDFPGIATTEQRAQSNGIVHATPEMNPEPSSDTKNRKALLSYFRKYNGSSTNAASRERTISTDTFKTCLSNAAQEQNFFSSRMFTDASNTSGVRTKRDSQYDRLFSSTKDNSNPFARFSAQPYNSRLRSWFNPKQHSSQTDKQSNLPTSAGVKHNERRSANPPKERLGKTPDNPFRTAIPAKRACGDYATANRPAKCVVIAKL